MDKGIKHASDIMRCNKQWRWADRVVTRTGNRREKIGGSETNRWRDETVKLHGWIWHGGIYWTHL